MKIYNTHSFINAIDDLLEDYYSKLTPREDFLLLFNLINGLRTSSPTPYIGFPITKMRNKFGRKIIAKKQIWILPELIKIAHKVGILDLTQYSRDAGLTTEYKILIDF